MSNQSQWSDFVKLRAFYSVFRCITQKYLNRLRLFSTNFYIEEPGNQLRMGRVELFEVIFIRNCVNKYN